MRFLIHRWYIVPVLALVALYCCSLRAVVIAQMRVREREMRLVDHVYRLVSEGRYSDLRAGGLISEESVKFLEMQDECFGRITTWDANDATPVYGLEVCRVFAVRPGLRERDQVSIPEPGRVMISLDYGQDDLERSGTQGRNEYGKPETVDQALSIGRRIAHKIDAGYDILSITAAKTGDYWLITETVLTPSDSDPTQAKPHKRYLVLSSDGEPVEHLSEDPGDSAYSSS